MKFNSKKIDSKIQLLFTINTKLQIILFQIIIGYNKLSSSFLKMCSTRKSTSISGNCQDYLKQFAFNQIDNFINKNHSNFLSVESFQPSNDKVEIIRSNKKIIKTQLRNSLLIPKSPSYLCLKGEKHTASSLRNLDSDDDSQSDKQLSDKQNHNPNEGSSQFFFTSTQKIISQAFSDKYMVEKKIGQGAHSTVYKCSSNIDNKFYALKQIKNVSFQNWLKLKNLYRMIKTLNHRSIIGYHDYHFDQQKRTAYVVMEYCDYNDLRFQLSKRIINGKTFSNKQIFSICKQISNVLMYLHQQGICHRDLKPQNILYCKNSGAIKIIDLDVCGVKKIKSEQFDMWTNTGTLFYRAPQSFQIGYTQKVDIWGLGIVVFELATGRTPFQTVYQKDFLNEIQNNQIDLKNVTTNCKLNVILQKCLQKDPNKRISASNLSDFMNSVIKNDECLMKFNKFQPQRKRTSYSDTYMGIVCLGNLLKLTYS